MIDRIKDAHRCLGRIARHDDDLDEALIMGQHVQFQQRPHQRKTGAELEYLVLIVELMPAVCFQSLRTENRFLRFKVKQRAGRNTNNQQIIK